ncbi:type IV secretory system conjugative DNA transfer family protein [Parasphingorhabdus sp. DH2-15]|uniref:type IV secretory system conjugative DNA transfer family protein n=1 Tax=Parasphingorhabdus sp. DH2-15 TaxID=3444112 RepID=UPI003F6859F7
MTNSIVSADADINRRPLATARLVPQKVIDQQGYQKGDFWLGRSLSGRPFGWYEDLNFLTCAGPRSGKGISTVIPNLLLYPGSAVVVDPKGELAELTAAYRKDKLGQKVIVLDPAGVADIPDDLRGTFNPLGALATYDDKDVVSAAQSIASGIVVPNPASKEPFWEQSALNFIQNVILYILKKFPAEERTLMKLRETCASGDITLFNEFVELKREDNPDFEADIAMAQEMLLDNMAAMDEFGGVVREAASKIRNFGDQTRGNVLGNVMTNLDFLNDPRLWDNLVHSTDPDTTFELSELRDQEQFITVYLCLPTDMMQLQGRWLRLVCAQIIQYIERSKKFEKSEHLPVLMMIDEFFQLGPFPSIVNTLTYAPSFGLRLWLIIQDLNQLKINYPKEWETILGACGVKQFFGVNELTTAKYVSELVGQAEVDVPTITMTQNQSETKGKTDSKTHGTSTTETFSTSHSRTIGNSHSHTSGKTVTDSFSNTSGTSSSSSKGTSGGASTSTSKGENEGWSQATNSSTSKGNSANFNRPNQVLPTSTSKSGGSSQGSNQGTSGGTSFSITDGKNSGWSDQHTHSTNNSTTYGRSTGFNTSDTYTTNESKTVTRTHSMAYGVNRSRTEALSQSATQGQSLASGTTKQTRSLFRPEELLQAFTKDNQIQLVYIRDRGAHLLVRTPYFADRDFFKKIESTNND